MRKKKLKKFFFPEKYVTLCDDMMNNSKVNVHFYELKKYKCSLPLTLKKFNFSFPNKFVL